MQRIRSSRANVVNVHAAKTQFSKLIERAHHGEEIILAKNGVAYARLVPLAASSAAPARFSTSTAVNNQHANLARAARGL